MKHWQRDLLIVFVSIFVAIILVRTHLFAQTLTVTLQVKLLGSFIAGLFFTSFFTIPIATAAFVEIMRTDSLFLVAFIGAFGAMIGDLVLFSFAKNSLSKDFDLLCKYTRGRRCVFMTRKGIWRYLTPAIGALIIASPLPDELGLVMMGIANVDRKKLIPISYCMNFLGILLVGFVF